ncbi:MAG: hypothetical protein V4726_07175 [Verrucomicrobiota bacterium]
MSPEKFIAIVRDALRDPDLLPHLPQILSSELACDILADLKPVIRQEGAFVAETNNAAEPLKPRRVFSARPLDEAGLEAIRAAINRSVEAGKKLEALKSDEGTVRERLKTAMEQAGLLSDVAYGISDSTSPPRWTWLPNRAGLLDALVKSREIIDNLSTEVSGKKASGSVIGKIDNLITKAKGDAA